MPYKEKEITKLYYSIGEVATMFDVATSLIRFWESEFDVLTPGKNKKGNRVYTKKDIETVKLIYHLVKEKGYTLAGAKDIIKNERKRTLNKLETIDSLTRVKSFLEELRNKL